MTTMLSEQARVAGPHGREIDPQTLRNVRAAVRDVLLNSPAYNTLPQEVRRGIAQDMVTVGAYLVDGEGARPPAAAALADQSPADTAGSAFGRSGGAVAAQAGVGAFTEEVNKVDFPNFVASLIHGTFDAIVTASIRQMDAYANLLKNVTKSVDQYMSENVTQNNARDYLAQQYPEHLEVDASGDQPKLKPKGTTDDLPLPDFMKDLGLPQPVESLDEDTAEQTLVPAARQRMALDRQHLLATMVLMGINRLVVTDGNIEAKVLFQLDTQDRVTKAGTQTATASDQYKYRKESSGWFSPTVKQDYTSNFAVTTAKSDSSAAEADLHTKLSGQVAVRFKSETFPLDKMADLIGVDHVAGQAVGTGRNVGAQPAATGVGPPPLPPMTLTPPASAPAR